MSLICNTCRIQCDTIELLKEHYRDRLHTFNSNRRSKNLAPVSKEDYQKLEAKLGSKSTHVVKQTKVEPSKAYKTKALNTGNILGDHALNTNSQLSSNSSVLVSSRDHVKSDNTIEIEDVESDVGDEEEQPIEKPKISPLISIFDNKEYENIESCLQSMVTKYGFFLPDAEYISDLEGLLTYLNEKVKLGGICLYCQRHFRSGIACQHHMIEKSHCKLTYEDNVDMDEYEDFYDFSSTYEDIDSDEEDDEDEEPSAEISTTTKELILPDGRILGHRDYRIYYKQYYRPEEDRDSVIAQKKEELLRLNSRYNSEEGVHSEELVANMSDMEVQAALIKHYKLIRKHNITEQRGMMQRLAMDQKREYKSKVQAARSSATTTAKIRDYHKSVL